MTHPVFSVIVPAYNASNTIETCIRSIENQSFKNFEIIIIDDGSTDSTYDMVKLLAIEYSNIKLIHTKNSGVSNARNIGLASARGEWITFCDSDDHVETDWLKNFVQISDENELKVQGFFTNKSINGRGTQKCKYGVEFSGNAQIGQTILFKNNCLGYLWVKAFKREIVKNYELKFDMNLTKDEDQDFIIRYINHIKKLASINDAGYNYIVPNWGSKYTDDYFYYFVELLEKSKVKNTKITEGSLSHGYALILESLLFKSIIEGKKDIIKRIGTYKKSLSRHIFLGNSSLSTKIIIYCIPSNRIISNILLWKNNSKIKHKINGFLIRVKSKEGTGT